MQDQNVANAGFSQVGTAPRINRVLRNTYMLLAVSMIPTVIGAWFGVVSGLDKTMLASPGLSLIVFLVGAFGFMFAIERTKNSATGIAVLLGFTFFMGLMLSRMIGLVLGMNDGATLIGMAFGGTSVIFFGMATLATVIKRDLSGMGKFLFIGAMIVFVASLMMVFFPIPALMLALVVMMLVIFSLYMMYDINQVVRGGETNFFIVRLDLFLVL